MIKLLILLIATSSFGMTNTLSIAKLKTNAIKETLSNFSFNYFVNYTGPSLNGDYQNGATFNRFSGGVDFNGNDVDSTGSTEVFQSFKLSYTFKNKMSLSYGVTMQESLNDNIEYTNSFGKTSTRSSGVSYNGHRTSLFIPSVMNFSFGWLSTSFFYQTPVASERASGNIYVAGLQPNFRFYSSIAGLSYGIGSNIERLVSKDEVSQNKQGLRLNIMPNISYKLTESLTLKKKFDFDWDQKGEQLGTTSFGRNMHNIGLVGLGAKVAKSTFIDVYMTYSLSEFSSKNTSLGASLDISI